jgi:hypothetical protein
VDSDGGFEALQEAEATEASWSWSPAAVVAKGTTMHTARRITKLRIAQQMMVGAKLIYGVLMGFLINADAAFALPAARLAAVVCQVW